MAAATPPQLLVLGRPDDAGEELLREAVPPALDLAHATVVADSAVDGRPSVVVLASGDGAAVARALELARDETPVFVVDAAVARAWRAHRVPRREGVRSPLRRPARAPRAGPGPPDDPLVRELVERPNVVAVEPGVDPAAFARRLAWELHDEPVLKSAWEAFAAYDAAAVRYRRHYERFQGSILAIGIAATAVALIHDSADLRAGERVAHWLVVALPIAAATLIAISNRLAAGKRWVLLRGAAESVKRDIYRYRTGTGPYGDAARGGGPAPAEVLASQLAAVDELLMQTEVSSGDVPSHTGELPPGAATGAGDDGLSPLGADDYIRVRLADQLAFYRSKIPRLARRRQAAALVTLVAGGAGTLVAAAGWEIWVGLTTAIAGAAIAYLAYLQIESTIVAYNQAASRLQALRRRWIARGAARADAGRDALGALVEDTEAILATEHAGWLQQMNDALAKVDAREDARERDAEAGAGGTADGVAPQGR